MAGEHVSSRAPCHDHPPLLIHRSRNWCELFTDCAWVRYGSLIWLLGWADLRRQEDLAPGAGEECHSSLNHFVSLLLLVASHIPARETKTHTKDGNATDKSGVLGRGKSVISGGEDTLGGPAGGLLDVDSLGRHFDYVCLYVPG
jgi:hypothetical protein